jgi:hypothetical protein
MEAIEYSEPTGCCARSCWSAGKGLDALPKLLPQFLNHTFIKWQQTFFFLREKENS